MSRSGIIRVLHQVNGSQRVGGGHVEAGLSHAPDGCLGLREVVVAGGQLEMMGLYRAGAGPCPSDRFDDLTVRILGERLDGGGAHVA